MAVPSVRLKKALSHFFSKLVPLSGLPSRFCRPFLPTPPQSRHPQGGVEGGISNNQVFPRMDFLQTLLSEPLFELFFWEISTARIDTNLLRSTPHQSCRA